jgi:hypothetical protein
VLSDDLIELPTLVRQLVEAQARTEARVAELAEAQARAEARLAGVEGRMDRVEAAIERLAEVQARTELRLAKLAAAQTRTEAIVNRHTDQLGELQGEALELRYARRAPSYFSPIARRLRVVEDGPLADLLDDAVDEGQLTGEERAEILLADLVLTGRRRQDSQDIYLLAEVSVGVGPHDVEHAVARAALLAKLGRPVLPVVAGKSITDQAATLAKEQGVWYAEGGRVTAPRDA